MRRDYCRGFMLLAGCGFTPLYGDHSTRASPGVAEARPE